MINHQSEVRAIAIYLPQFHPIPENDEWWGKGFTEWTNVSKAKPVFWGHYQPHQPADLGFYDLRLPEVRLAQADLAKHYGIDGFCYYHYWFNGKRLLNRPIDDVLSSRKPDFPFCLCWANENWTRRWDGKESNVLIQQNYSYEDDREHIRWLSKVFNDERYIRIDGKPIFIVYRISDFPNPKNTAELWREEAIKLGIGEIFLCAVEGNFPKNYTTIYDIGFDAVINFQPAFSKISDFEKSYKRIISYMMNQKGHIIYDYGKFTKKMIKDSFNPDYRYFPCVTPSWDNTSRRKRDGLILTNSSPDLYEDWLKHEIKLVSEKQPNQENLVFLNAWNEWAEGNHLEPCMKWGKKYLEATSSALKKY